MKARRLASACPSAPGAGVGLKPQHFRDILGARPALGFFEVHAENYLGAGGPFHHYLGRIADHYPLSVHGVGLSIGGRDLDLAHLDRLAALLARYEPQWFSEHLAWSRHGPVCLNDLLPVVYDTASLDRVCEHIDRIQSRLKRRLLLENPATYLESRASTLPEAARALGICEEALALNQPACLNFLTWGQILSLPMFLFGLGVEFYIVAPPVSVCVLLVSRATQLAAQNLARSWFSEGAWL